MSPIVYLIALLCIFLLVVVLGGAAGILVFVIALVFVVYYYKTLNITTNINANSAHPEITITKNNESNTSNVQSNMPIASAIKNAVTGEQVFNIPDNNYTYQDAKAVCKAYGARLATYNEVESAYEAGANWCSAGWSDEQLVLFPIQKQFWQNMQKIKGHEHDCGRQGVNGGYIPNANQTFGVNCYGIKPPISQDEIDDMNMMSVYPKTKEDIEFDDKVKYWRTRLSDILLSPFNSTRWSRV